MITVTVSFQDKNMPDVSEEARTPDEALVRAATLARRFAGLRTIKIKYSDRTDVYAADGTFMFGVPRI